MLHGKDNFSGGETTIQRVSPGSPAVLSRCSGYKIDAGHLEPDGLVSLISDGLNPLPSTVPEQSPFPFMDNATLKLICRDKDEKTRELVGTTWGAAGGVVDVLKESVPCRLGRQVVFATGGADSKLMAYEPASASTKLRPLSFKSPADYVTGAKPSVAPSAAPGLQLFDVVVTTGEWAQPAPTKGTVSNAADVATFTILDACTAGTKLFTKDLGATGILLDGKEMLLLDVFLADDPQNYSTFGLFANDPKILPSGYELALYSDQACTTAICTLRIPRLTTSGMVHRVALKLPSIAAGVHVKGLGLLTSSFFVKPETGKTFTLKLYSEAFNDNWAYKGNFLMPAIQWPKSYWAQVINQVSEGSGQVTTIPANNLVQNPSFEDSTGGVPDHWTLSGGVHYRDVTAGIGAARSGKYAMDLPNSADAGYIQSEAISVIGGKQYSLDVWYIRHRYYTSYFRISVIPNSGPQQDFPSASTWFSATDSSKFALQQAKFTLAAAATSCQIRITAKTGAYSDWVGVLVDDIALYLLDQTAAGSAWVLQTFSEAMTTKTPENHLVRYSYCFAGKSILSADDYALMVSNPSDASSPDIVADPWRIPAVTIALPHNSDSKSIIDDYGDYATHCLVYRSTFDGSTGVWDDWQYVTALALTDFVADSLSWNDGGNDNEIVTVCNGLAVPLMQEIANDYASPARYALVSEGRVYAGCLDWDNVAGVWKRPTAIEVSSYRKQWAYPTTNDETSLVTDGSELDGYAVTGSEIRGLIARNDEKFVFLDNEFFLLRGDNPLQGWQFIRLDSIGCVSARTLADCRSAIIWHDGNHFYAYRGGLAEPISRYRIDSTKIDWTKPHNAVYCNERYIFFCKYNSEWCLLIYDLVTGGWRIRHSAALNLVGICAEAGVVYGITPAGDAVNLFGSTTTDYGVTDGVAVREVWTEYLVLASPTQDVRVNEAVFEVITDQVTPINLTLTFDTQGAMNAATPVVKTLPVDSTKTQYRVKLNLMCDAIRIKASYTGVHPPTIYYIGVDTDDVGARP